jgi:hypothetical protein
VNAQHKCSQDCHCLMRVSLINHIVFAEKKDRHGTFFFLLSAYVDKSAGAAGRMNTMSLGGSRRAWGACLFIHLFGTAVAQIPRR